MPSVQGAYAKWSKESSLALLETLRPEPGPVLLALQTLQAKFGYIRKEDVELVAHTFNVSRAEVHGVLTFYEDLRQTPPPSHIVRICVAEACQSVGSRALAAKAEESLGTNIGEVNPEVEIQATYCFGNCALGPASMVNGSLIGRSTLEKIRSALSGSGYGRQL